LVTNQPDSTERSSAISLRVNDSPFHSDMTQPLPSVRTTASRGMMAPLIGSEFSMARHRFAGQKMQRLRLDEKNKSPALNLWINPGCRTEIPRPRNCGQRDDARARGWRLQNFTGAGQYGPTQFSMQ
jgi:hypothetical protein